MKLTSIGKARLVFIKHEAHAGFDWRLTVNKVYEVFKVFRETGAISFTDDWAHGDPPAWFQVRADDGNLRNYLAEQFSVV